MRHTLSRPSPATAAAAGALFITKENWNGVVPDEYCRQIQEEALGDIDAHYMLLEHGALEDSFQSRLNDGEVWYQGSFWLREEVPAGHEANPYLGAIIGSAFIVAFPLLMWAGCYILGAIYGGSK